MKMLGESLPSPVQPNAYVETSTAIGGISHLTIGFWNVHKNPKAEPDIAKLAAALQNENGQRNDVLLGMSEIKGLNLPIILANLKKMTGDNSWALHQSPSGKFACYSNTPLTTIQQEAAHGWPVIICLKGASTDKNPTRCAVWFVHLRAPMMTFSPENVSIADAQYLHKNIIDLEGEQQLDSSVAIGDFNADPYSNAMLGPDNLNAVMCQRVAFAQKRIFYANTPNARIRPYFYNPMWNSLGDQSATKQPGSLYRANDPGNSNAWHLIDQVILRPSLMHRIVRGSARLMTDVGGKPLLDMEGRIDVSISDHLPVVISLNN